MTSAISNTAYGVATEGQLGLVDGPTVRTFSQVGRTDGAPGAGEIGEYLEASCSALTTATAADTYVDATGMSITLAPGTWQIGYDVTAALEWVSGSDVFLIGTIAISDAANNILTSTVSYMQIRSASDNTKDLYIPCSRKTVVQVATTTTYKVRFRTRDTNGRVRLANSSLVTGLTDPDNSSNIWALRIA